SLPVAGLHVDLVRAPGQLDAVIEAVRPETLLSLGVIDGRNVWRANLSAILERLEPVAAKRDLILAPSCSLLHVPVDLGLEPKLNPKVRQWLAFAVQKIEELATLKRALNEGRQSVAEAIDSSSEAAQNRATSSLIHDQRVQRRVEELTVEMRQRQGGHADRAAAQ